MMKLRKNIIATIMAVALAATMLGACGGKDAGNQTPEATEAATGENETADATQAPQATEEVKATEAPTVHDPAEAETMSLDGEYKDLFSMGVAVNSWQLADPDVLAQITKDYSSITCENEMKPDYVLDYEKTIASEDGMPEINTENIDKIMTMAEEAGLKMRGHTLIWHNQTPGWLFHEDYDEGKDYVNKKTMLKRMEAYIKKVLTFCEEEHPGTVYAWDVVNECASDGNGLREDSPWYITIGNEYIEKAFEYARKYAGKDVKLYLNDYNTEVREKRNVLYNVVSNLHKKGLIDGFGMQSHHDAQYFDANSVKNTIMKFAVLEGLEIQLTELDLHYNDNSEEAMLEQAKDYRELFDVLVSIDKNGDAPITNVTFWGLDDEHTWLSGFKGETSYPLLYDGQGVAKQSYFSVVDALREYK